jgi:excisionase family DNA binding protein
MADTVTLAEAAEQLGVHYMTAYRYVRTGLLPATKTGGVWSVSVDDLEAFRSRPAERPTRKKSTPLLIERRLLAGDDNGTLQLLNNARASGADCDELYLDLLCPALTSIGTKWAAGELSVADEHVATATITRVLPRLEIGSSVRGRSHGTILLAAVEFDHHALPTSILRELLRNRQYGVAVPVVLGGGALGHDEHASTLGPCIRSTSPRHALELFDELRSATTAD